ncbi:putative leader peptide [Streptomyces sp. P6-2-1]|uniref:putative leader peptide n=1 Tax=Streptomyces sp. P6-2-1 TaxID=3422591 RepID=UPI003D368FA4
MGRTGARTVRDGRTPARGAAGPAPARHQPPGTGELTALLRRGLLPIMTDTDVRLWRRVHMDLLRYAGCVCRRPR